MSKRTKVVELFDTMTEVLGYIETANNTFGIINKTCIVDYCFITDEEEELKYKVTVTAADDYERLKKEE